jgi:hypothetical protein
VDIDRGLVVDAGREHLAAGGRNGGIPQNDLRRDAAHRLDAERERRDIEEQHLAVAGDQNVGLDRGAERHDLVGVELAMRRLAEQFCDQSAHEGNAGGPADQDDLVDLRGVELRVAERLQARAQRAIDDGSDQLFEFRPGDPLAEELCLFVIGEIPLRLNDGLADLLDLFRRRGPAKAGHDVRGMF